MSIIDIRGQISQAGGLSNPSRYSVQITPPAIFNSAASATQLNQLSQANIQGQPSGNTSGITNYFNMMGVDKINASERLDFMCNSASLPGRGFSTSDVRTYGATFKMPYMSTYSDFQATFICGHDMWERDFFDAWMYTIEDPGSADYNYRNDYSTTILVWQLDEFDNSTYGIQLFEAWPITLGDLRVAYDQRNSFHVFPVTFTYFKWENVRVDVSTPTSVEPAGDEPKSFESTIFQSNK